MNPKVATTLDVGARFIEPARGAINYAPTNSQPADTDHDHSLILGAGLNYC